MHTNGFRIYDIIADLKEEKLNTLVGEGYSGVKNLIHEMQFVLKQYKDVESTILEEYDPGIIRNYPYIKIELSDGELYIVIKGKAVDEVYNYIRQQFINAFNETSVKEVSLIDIEFTSRCDQYKLSSFNEFYNRLKKRIPPKYLIDPIIDLSPIGNFRIRFAEV